MGYTFEWSLTGLRKQNTETLNNVVIGTHWKVTATNEDGDVGTFVGATPFELQDLNHDGFVDYRDLSEDLVLGWIKSEVSGSAPRAYWDHISQQIQKEIDTKKYHRVHVNETDLPWAPTSGSNLYGVDPQPA
jgi:hypothetical protein